MKLGKKPYEPDARSLKLSKYLATDLPTPPKIFGYGTLFTDWGYLGNDKYGDCVFAGGGHEQMVWDTLRKGPGVKITTKNALSDYSAVTGFDPSDPNTDQGTYVIDAMKYRKATGLVDSSGKRHKIAAYVEIDPTNWDELITASYIFGAVGIGFEFPDTAFDQFDNGEYWDVVKGSFIDGGHYVPIIGSRNSEARVTCVTWGQRQQMTKRFYQTYCDEPGPCSRRSRSAPMARASTDSTSINYGPI